MKDWAPTIVHLKPTRNDYALAAMTSIAARNIGGRVHIGQDDFDRIAKHSFQLADAMIAESKKEPKDIGGNK